MGIASNGPHGNHRGRIGNVVYYVLNGKNVAREIGKTTKPPTQAQLKVRSEIKLVSQFLKPLGEFINVGFGIEQLGTDKNAFNLAMAYNRPHAIKGSYPNLKIAYEKVQISKGPLKTAENLRVEESPAGLQFNWDTNPQMAWQESTDQAMVLVYFPDQKKVFYTLFGNSRLSGTMEQEIPASLKGKHMESYISFISADRKQVSDSIYTGRFNSPEANEISNSNS
ncbi:hypothetical protein DBR11_27410 [Pedobacter sp. HMWF019]|uniref:DUF6266 family protein n=1 Tax=Pedobacter sp. HMWF019 TaxID=2056856 RepID=UPI000D3BAFCC|nr:DUF6266 family protein [Pedobacter sp. HMWF019]PTS92188.1 hypothetical protein DBR11_27410 [Pedobacter sp. HMWF019]